MTSYNDANADANAWNDVIDTNATYSNTSRYFILLTISSNVFDNATDANAADNDDDNNIDGNRIILS